jgi:hypothetical protein
MFRFDDTDSPQSRAGEPTRTPPVGSAKKPADGGSESREPDIPPWFARYLQGGRPLPPEVQAVVDDIVGPLYRKMVLEEKDALLRATGNAVVVAQTVEVLSQPEVLEAAQQALDGGEASRDEFAEVLGRYLRITKERSRAMNLHLQLRRAKHASWQVPGDPYGIMTMHGCGI